MCPVPEARELDVTEFVPEVTYDCPRRNDGAFMGMGAEFDGIRMCLEGEMCNGDEIMAVGEGGFPVVATAATDLTLTGEESLVNARPPDVGDIGGCGERLRIAVEGLLRLRSNVPVRSS